MSLRAPCSAPLSQSSSLTCLVALLALLASLGCILNAPADGGSPLDECSSYEASTCQGDELLTCEYGASFQGRSLPNKRRAVRCPLGCETVDGWGRCKSECEFSQTTCLDERTLKSCQAGEPEPKADEPAQDSKADVLAPVDHTYRRWVEVSCQSPTPYCVLGFWGASCSASPPPSTDMGSSDMGSPDMSQPDMMRSDMSQPDMSQPDMSVPDMSQPDMPDAGMPDAGMPDADM